MTNERTLTATNEILVGNELIEEYLFDETKKAILEEHFNTLVEKAEDMVFDTTSGIIRDTHEHGLMVMIDTDAVYDMIDDMYLSLPWEAPRWGKVDTSTVRKSNGYCLEKIIITRALAARLGGYTNTVLFNLGEDAKCTSWEVWEGLTEKQKDMIFETEYEFLHVDNLFIPYGTWKVERVENFDNLFCEYCEQLRFDIENLSLNAEMTCNIEFTENGEVTTIEVKKTNRKEVKKVNDTVKKATKLIDMNLHKVDKGKLLKSFGDAHSSLVREFKQLVESEKFLNFARSGETTLQDGQLRVKKVDGLYKFNYNSCIEECMELFFNRKIHFNNITFDLYDQEDGKTIYNVLLLQVAINLFEIGFLY